MGLMRGRRKGYLHALEGVIAALIVVAYLNSIVSVPGTTDWQETRIAKQSEDLMEALDRSGFLDRTVLRDDADSFNAFVDTVSSSLSYSVNVRGLPKRHVAVAVLVNNSSTHRSATNAGLPAGASGLPSSEDGAYRSGTLVSDGFGGIDFVLSDMIENDFRRYSAVNFDFNGNGNFGDSGEGPYNVSDRTTCPGAGNDCPADVYAIGPANDTLVLYNASTASWLADTASTRSIGRRTVDLAYDTVNPFDGRLDTFDVLWIDGWGADEIAAEQDLIEDFLREGRLVVIHAAVTKDAIDGNAVGDLGFDYIGKYRVTGPGRSVNELFSLHGPGNRSYRATQYYLEGGIRIDGFTDAGGYDEATIDIRGQSVAVRRWNADTVAFGSEGFAVNHSTGATVVLRGNRYTIDAVTPLVLSPSGQQRFDSFNTTRIDADYHMTRMTDRTYNITELDTSASFTPGETYDTRGDIPGEYAEGLANTNCGSDEVSYKNGTIPVDGTSYTFMLVNFELEQPCDDYFEFVYFDLNHDGDFDDRDLPESSDEGPYQQGDTVNVSGNGYSVKPGREGDTVTLKRLGPRFAAELPVSRDVFGRGGAAALVRRPALGDDDMSLITALMARETQATQSFTAPRTLGDVSLGHTYSSAAGDKTSFGYTLETVWWFQ